jgi:hypothetical protein
MRSPPAVLLVLVLLVSVAPASAVPTSADTPSVDASHDGIDVTSTVSLTPDAPGEVGVEAAFDLPTGLTSLTVELPDGATVTGRDGFRRSDAHTYEWTGGDHTPTLTYDLPVNRTVTRGTGSGDVTGYLYADTGAWALLPAPSLGLSYSGVGDRASVERSVVVAGEGATGGQIVYLGPVREYTARVDGQRIRLVVPEDAELAEPPREVLDTLATAAERVRFGERDPEVFFVAAPSSVAWVTTGLQRGPDDAWVRDVQRLDTPDNVWVHEYVHTRQQFTTDAETRWTTEGMADYYAALLALEAGHIDYDRFRRHLDLGRRASYDDVVLAEPGTWQGTQANYRKGALAMAALDRQLRLAGDATMQDVVARTNDGRLTQTAFLEAVEAVGDDDVRVYAREHTETSTTPATWSREAHAEAFGGIPAVRYDFEAFQVRGPYRNRSYDTPPTLAPGETLTVVLTAENRGDRNGSYSATLTYRGADYGTRSGSLAPAERTTLSWTLSPGVGAGILGVGGLSHRLAVQRPATATVTGIEVPRSVAAGEPVAVTVTAANGRDRPAERSVPVRVDGTTAGTLSFRLAPGETHQKTVITAFEEPGVHSVSAAGETVTVRVHESASATAAAPGPTGTASTSVPQTTGTARRTSTGASGAGFGALAALTAVGALLGIGLGKRRYR